MPRQVIIDAYGALGHIEMRVDLDDWPIHTPQEVGSGSFVCGERR